MICSNQLMMEYIKHMNLIEKSVMDIDSSLGAGFTVFI